MGAVLLDGRALAAEVRSHLRERVRRLREAAGIEPGLAVVLVGDDPASQTYVRNKERAAAEVGVRSVVFRLPAGAGRTEALALLRDLDGDPAWHGVLIQAPVPPPLDLDELIQAVRPEKDVDGFHPVNLGLLMRGRPGLVACTPLGVMALLGRAGVALRGRHAVVVGRSVIVGRPMSLLLLAADATVTVCHRHTPYLTEHTRRADVLVVAVGRAGLVRPDMVKPGAAVVDVGINRTDAGLVGDVDPAVAGVASFLTPVPGGVGPMTVAMLLANTILAAERQLGLGAGPVLPELAELLPGFAAAETVAGATGRGSA